MFLPVEPVSNVREMSPLYSCLVEGAQQPAADENEGRRGQDEPLLWANLCLGFGRRVVVFDWEDLLFLFFILRVSILSKVLSTDVLEDGQAQGTEQKVPRLMLLFHKTAGRQAECVCDCAGQEQNIQLWQRPLTATALQGRLREGTRELSEEAYLNQTQTQLKGLTRLLLRDTNIFCCYLVIIMLHGALFSSAVSKSWAFELHDMNIHRAQLLYVQYFIQRRHNANLHTNAQTSLWQWRVKRLHGLLDCFHPTIWH